MKSYWSNTLNNAAGALKQTISSASTPKPVDVSPSPPGGEPSQGGAAPTAEKQYLRLPLESAKKLRWYDKVDLQGLVRNHSREKRELYDTITALKKIIIRSGRMDSSELDEEVQQLLAHSAELQENDEGVNSVLIISVQAELDELHEQYNQLQKEAEQLNARLLGSEVHSDYRFSIGSEMGTTPTALTSEAEAAASKLSCELNAAMEQLEHYMAATTSLSKQVRRCEGDISVAESMEAFKHLGAADGSHELQTEGDGDEASFAAGNAAMLAKLQRLEAERLNHSEQLADMSQQMAQIQEVAAEEEKLRAKLDAATEKNVALSSIIESLRAELCGANAQVRSAEDDLDKKEAEIKKLQQTSAGADALRKYQDICLDAEERAAMSERKVAAAEARASKAEGSLKEALAEVKKKEKTLTAVQNEQRVLMSRLAKMESLTIGKTAEEKGRRNEAASQKAAEQLEAAESLQRSLKHEVAALSSALEKTEQRCQAAEAIEARLMAELREAENVAHDRDELCAQVMLLRDKLSEQRAEKGQAEQYKQVVHELETGRSKLEEELMATAQLVTQLESRLRETLHKVDGSEMSVQVAERRAREAEAAVASEVELRMSAACSSRAFWPAPIRDEVARMEQRLSAMQSSLVVAEAQLSTERATIEAEGKAKYEALHALGQAQDSLGHTEELVKMKQLELNEAQELVEQARVTVLKLEAANEELSQQAANASAHASSGGARPSGDRVNGESASSKWQVQNSVGGGSLYGLGDKAQARSSTTSVASLSPRGSNSNIAASKRPKVESVDVLYLKNVLLKFMEASVTGKVAERDVLLPAVATLLQASPAEFALLKKLLQNTAPPGTQMMSVFGFKV